MTAPVTYYYPLQSWDLIPRWNTQTASDVPLSFQVVEVT